MINWLTRNSRNIFFVLAIASAMPLPFPYAGGVMWLSPFLFLNSVLATRTFVLINLLGLLSLILIFVRPRFVCKHICPLGVVCDFASGANKKRKGKTPGLKGVNRFFALLSITAAIFGVPVLAFFDPFNIFHISIEVARTGVHLPGLLKLSILLFIILLNIVFPHIWCRSICPLGGLQLLAIDVKNFFAKKRTDPKNSGRRLFLAGFTGLLTGIALPRFLKTDSGFIRPPSALPDSEMNTVCVRCGSCINVCPTNILKHQFQKADFESLLTPVVDFSRSYCLPECTACGDVCPSGALSKFGFEKKQTLKMAMAYIDPENCLLHQQKECNLCKLNCKYDAINYEKMPDSISITPVIVSEKCVGCGACKIVCPEQVISMSRV